MYDIFFVEIITMQLLTLNNNDWTVKNLQLSAALE